MNTFIIFTKCIQNALFFSSSFFVQTILDCVYKSSLKCWYEWQWRPNTSTSRPVKSWLSEFVDHFALLWTLCFWRFDLTTCGSFFFFFFNLPLWIDGHLPGASVQTSLLNSAASTFIYSLSLSLCVLLPHPLFFPFSFHLTPDWLTGSRPVLMNFSIEHVECHEEGEQSQNQV